MLSNRQLPSIEICLRDSFFPAKRLLHLRVAVSFRDQEGSEGNLLPDDEVFGRLFLCFSGKKRTGDLGGLFWFSSRSYKSAMYFIVRRKACCNFMLRYHYIELTNEL